MKKNNLHNKIIENRVEFILDLIKGGKDIERIERETALLAIDVIDGLKKKEAPMKQACNCFRRIIYAIDYKTDNQLSNEFQDLMHEALILDELNTKYGPDLDLLIEAATKILTRKKFFPKKIKRHITAVRV